MSILQLPFEITEAVINKLDADSLLNVLKTVPQQYPEIQRSILMSLLQLATDQDRLDEYLYAFKPSADLLKECLFRFKQRGQLYIIAKLFNSSRERVFKGQEKQYVELSKLEGLRDQDLLESARDLLKQGRTELAKRFLLTDRKYDTQTPELLQIYAIEHKINNLRSYWIPQPHSCALTCFCKAPWYTLDLLELAHSEAKKGNIKACRDVIGQAKHHAMNMKLPEPDTRQMEVSMYQNAVRIPLQRVHQLFQLLKQEDTLLGLGDLESCRSEIRQAKETAKEGGLPEPETGELMGMIESMENLQKSAPTAPAKEGLPKPIEGLMKLIRW